MLSSGNQNVYVYISSCHFIGTFVSVLTIGVYRPYVVVFWKPECLCLHLVMSFYKYFCVCANNRCIPDLMLLSSGNQNVYVYISSCHFISTFVSVLTIGVYQTLCCCLYARMFMSTFRHVML